MGVPGGDGGSEGSLGTPPARVVSAASLEDVGWDDALAHASEAPLRAVVSGRPPPVLVEPPRRVRAERTSSVRVRAFEPVEVTLDHPGGSTDTLRLEAGETGAFLLRPFSPGWRSWRMGVAPDGGSPAETRWATLVRPARPLRVLAISGLSGPEPRAATRALEESGEVVETWTSVGRGLWVGRDGRDLPTDPEAYAGFDVVVLFPGVALSPASTRALLSAVTELGKGLLLAGTTGGAPELQRVVATIDEGGAWSDEVSVTGDALTWHVPPEVTPLPALPIDTRLLVPDGRADDSAPGYAALGLGTLGRGRVGALALPDTWIWRMSAGAADGHRAFWRDQVAWLAGGFQEDPVLELLAADVRRGEQVLVRRIDRPSDATGPTTPTTPPAIGTRTPSDLRTVETVPLPSTPTARLSLAAFVPMETGAHLIGGDGDALAPDHEPTLALHVASEDDAGLDAEGRLARIALGSPGGSVVVDQVGAAESPEATGPGWPWQALLFSFLAVLLTAEWFRRRLTARP
jgi:hypothetical protein